MLCTQTQPLQACTSRQPPQCFWPKQHPQLRALGAAARNGVLHPTKVTNCRALAPAASDCPHRECLQVQSLRPGRSCVDDPTCHPTTRNTIASCDSSLCGFRSVDCPLRLRVDDAIAFRREDDKDWVDGWRAQLSCSASRRATLVTHLFSEQEPAHEFLQQSPCRSPGPTLGSGQRSLRQTEKLQILSWNLVLHVAQINAPWPATSTDLGTSSVLKKEAGFVTDRSLAENVYVITQHR